MIYDATNKQALIYVNGHHKIIYVDDIELPPMDRNERRTRQLCKHFYDTVAIKERYNPKCRMSFMPKRVWGNLTEMQTDILLPESK
jgi:probable DNA metabolism protein